MWLRRGRSHLQIVAQWCETERDVLGGAHAFSVTLRAG
jgi:hypothetical protein